MEATFMLIIFMARFGYEDPLNTLNKKKRGGGCPVFHPIQDAYDLGGRYINQEKLAAAVLN